MTPATYEIKRDETDHRKVKPWIVVKNGEPLKYSPRDSFPKTFRSKRLATIAATKDTEWDSYMEIVLADDASGEYRWTVEELAQIDELVLSLKLNEEKWTFNGKARFVDISRGHQARDAEDSRKTNWTEAHYPVQLRRRMAARAEAFKRAGVTL